MSIVGERPETGMRLRIERPLEGGPPYVYAGDVATAEGARPLSAVVDANGDVEVRMEGADAALLEKLRLMIRAAFRHAREDARPPPRRIQRWRKD
jgi:hypothetical protein